MQPITDVELDSMRTEATSGLHDVCLITRAGADPVFDTGTGLYSTPDPVELWSGACQVRPMSQESQKLIGDIDTIVDKYVATIPFDADGFAVNDFLTVTEATDAELVGRSFRIYAVRWSSPQINRRLILEDQQRTEPA